MDRFIHPSSTTRSTFSRINKDFVLLHPFPRVSSLFTRPPTRTPPGVFLTLEQAFVLFALNLGQWAQESCRFRVLLNLRRWWLLFTGQSKGHNTQLQDTKMMSRAWCEVRKQFGFPAGVLEKIEMLSMNPRLLNCWSRLLFWTTPEKMQHQSIGSKSLGQPFFVLSFLWELAIIRDNIFR